MRHALRSQSFRSRNHPLRNVRFAGIERLSDTDKEKNRYTLSNQAQIYKELSKATLSGMVVITAGAGYCSYGGELSAITCANICAGTAFAAATAAIVNQLIERNTDKLMKRTCNRPLPAGRISTAGAIGYGVVSMGASYATLKYGTNDTTLMLGFSNIALYGLYTVSKPKTEWNTWTGAVVGAIPPVMGWTAAGGDILAIEPFILGSTLFLWQFPHFFALSWINRKDYERGLHQMVPVNDPTGERTADLILKYSLYLLPVPILAAATEVTSSYFAIGGVAITSYLIKLAEDFEKDRSNKNASAVFKCSLWYLLVMLGMFVLHRKRDGVKDEDILKRMKEQIKLFCPHEVHLVLSSMGLDNLCPVVVKDKVEKQTTSLAIESFAK